MIKTGMPKLLAWLLPVKWNGWKGGTIKQKNSLCYYFA
jgi:hypothetical protein